MTTTLLAYFPSPPRGVWHLGPIPIRAYALCIIVGIVAALVIGDRRWASRGGERGVIYDIALWAVPFGLVGGRLYHLITDWRTYFGSTGAGADAALRIWDGGLGIWGAVALGGVGAWIGCRRRKIPLPAFGDAIAPGIVLAQAIGRLGNYFNQELYGRETTVPWGMEIFYRRDPSGIVDVHSLDGVSTGQVALVVQPTFLYELLWNVLLFVALIYLDRRFQLGHGRLFALYVAGYCVGRFCIELLRDDPATLIDGIRVNSFTSTFVFIGAVVYMILAPKGREDPAVLRATWATEEPAAEPEEEPTAAASPSEAVEVAGTEPEDEAAVATAERAAVVTAEDEPAEEAAADSDSEVASAEDVDSAVEEPAEAETGQKAEAPSEVGEDAEAVEESGEPEDEESAEAVEESAEPEEAEAVEESAEPEEAEAVEESGESADEVVPDVEAEAVEVASAEDVDSADEESAEPEEAEAVEESAEPEEVEAPDDESAEDVEPEEAEAVEESGESADEVVPDVEAEASEVEESAEAEEEEESAALEEAEAPDNEPAEDVESESAEAATTATPAVEPPQRRRRWWRRSRRP